MIAPAKPTYDHAAVNQQFEQMLPRIRLMALSAFRDKDHELRDELVAEVVGRAYAAFVRLARQGRAELGYATPLALFSIKQVKSGRRMGARLNIKDVSSEYAQMNKGISAQRLDQLTEVWQEVVVEDKQSGPAEIAAMFALHGVLYLSLEEMMDLEVVKGLTRAQMELLAARTSLLNDCFY